MTRKIDWTPPLGPLTPEELPEGDDYIGSYRDHDFKHYFDQAKVRLDFELIDPPACANLIVSMFMNADELDRNRRPSTQSKFYKLWVRANGGPPKRGERMSIRVFAGYWRLRIRWGLVKGEPSTPVVDALLERVAGGSAC